MSEAQSNVGIHAEIGFRRGVERAKAKVDDAATLVDAREALTALVDSLPPLPETKPSFAVDETTNVTAIAHDRVLGNDKPELDDAWFDAADRFEGQKLVKMGLSPTVGDLRAAAFELCRQVRGTGAELLAVKVHDSLARFLPGDAEQTVDQVRALFGETK